MTGNDCPIRGWCGAVIVTCSTPASDNSGLRWPWCHQTEEAFGCIWANRQQPYVVNHDQPCTEDRLYGLGHRIIGAVAAYEDAQVLQAEPRHLEACLNSELAERLEEKCFPGSRRATDHEIFAAADPL